MAAPAAAPVWSAAARSIRPGDYFSSVATASTCGDHRKLVDRGHARDAIAALREDGEVARQRQRIAADGNDLLDCAARQFLALELRAGARRIEHDGVLILDFACHQRPAEKVALLDAEGFQTLRVAGGEIQRL